MHAPFNISPLSPRAAHKRENLNNSTGSFIKGEGHRQFLSFVGIIGTQSDFFSCYEFFLSLSFLPVESARRVYTAGMSWLNSSRK